LFHSWCHPWPFNETCQTPNTERTYFRPDIFSCWERVNYVYWLHLRTLPIRQINQRCSSSFFRYQFFLQLKQDLLCDRLECPYETSVLLSAYSLQCKWISSYISPSRLSWSTRERKRVSVRSCCYQTQLTIKRLWVQISSHPKY